MSARTDNPLVRTAWEAVSQAHTTTSLAASCFADLGALFHAIADASAEHSYGAKLAKIGLYLTEDWARLHDSERESLEPLVAALRGALGVLPIENEGGAK